MKESTPHSNSAQPERPSGRRIAWLTLILGSIIALLILFPAEETIPPDIESLDEPFPASLDIPEETTQNAATPPCAVIVQGQVTFRGTPPAEILMSVITNDIECAKYYPKLPTTQFYRVSPSGGLQDVYVYVVGDLPQPRVPSPRPPVTLDFSKCLLEPYVFGMEKSQLLRIRNLDHNPHSVVGLRNERIGTGVLVRAGTEFTWQFASAAPFQKLRCPIHPWEYAYACVSEHPYFGVTDKDGVFTFPIPLACGTYKIVAHHRKLGELTQVVDITESSQTFNFSFSSTSFNGAIGEKDEEETSIESSLRKETNPIAVKTAPRVEPRETLSSGALAGSSPSSRDGATIRGRVALVGTPPPERQITDARTSRDCAPLQTNLLMTEFYRVSEDSGLADTVVLIKEGLGDRKFSPPETAVVVDQVRCQYTPQIVALQTGQKLLVRNSDPIMHNVHLTPVTPGNKESNKAQMPKAPDLQFVFNEPERFLKIRCDVHPWMFAYPFVVNHPFIAISDVEGNFAITNVPPGTYTLEAVHRKAGSMTKEIVVAGDQPVNFTFEAK